MTVWATSTPSLWEWCRKMVIPVPGVPGTGKALNSAVVQAHGLSRLTRVVCDFARFCRGCTVDCNEDRASLGNAYIAVDWDPTALHLRYQTSQERVSAIRMFKDFTGHKTSLLRVQGLFLREGWSLYYWIQLDATPQDLIYPLNPMITLPVLSFPMKRFTSISNHSWEIH